MSGFFTTPLSEADPEIFGSITDELGRQRNEIELIASENSYLVFIICIIC